MARTAWLGVLKRELQRAWFLHRHPHLRRGFEEMEAIARGGSGPDRRAFLQGLLRSGAGTLPLLRLAELAGAGRMGPPRPGPHPLMTYGGEPVTIIGAGVAGLTAAYRLSRGGVACTVYEGSARVGGRMCTLSHFNEDDMFCELGGEKVDTGHAHLRALAAELGVAVQSFGGPEEAGLEPMIYHGRGRRYSAGEVAAGCQPLAGRLAKDLAALFPDPGRSFVTYRYHQDLPAARRLDRTSLHDYLHSHAGEVEPWVLELFSQGYVAEYGLEAQEQSSINLLSLIGIDRTGELKMFGASDEAARIQGGSSRLTEALAAALPGRVPVLLEHRLVRIQRQSRAFLLTFQTGGKIRTAAAEQLILALPFTVLRQVEGLGELGLSPVKERCIRTIGYGTHAKGIIGYARRIWRSPQGAFAGNLGEGLAEGPLQSFWESSRAQPGPHGILTAFHGGRAGQRFSAGDLPGVVDGFERVEPGSRAWLDPHQAQMNWTRNPFSLGSYLCPKVGQYTTVFGSAGEPELEGRILFAGEHCSVENQGFMEGAVETGAAAARTALAQRGRLSEARAG